MAVRDETDENDVAIKHADPKLPDDKLKRAYWDVVRRSLQRIFKADPCQANDVQRRINEARPEDQEKFYQTEPYSVAADIAKATGAGSPAQQLEYLRIKHEVGYGDEPETPPQLFPAVAALTRA